MELFSKEQIKIYGKSLVQNDLKSGISVFLVALPLCLGIALASGAPLFSGLVAGIVAGLVISILSGSEISVSGPAAGLAVIVGQAIITLGSFNIFLVAVVLAGLIQIGLGWLRAGQLGSYFPESVIRGMLVAIGLVIILKQIPHALGDDQDYGGEFEFFQADNENTFTEIIRAVANFSPGALVISGLAILLLIFWEKLSVRGWRFFKTFPSGLAVVLLGVGLNELFRVFLPDAPGWYLGGSPIHMVSIPRLNNLGEIGKVLEFPVFSALSNPQVYVTALTIAVVASLESLLSLEASEAIDPERRIASPNRELIAQGIGNTISGLIGGLPITSVVVRTSANVYAGARTRMSAFVHGVLLLSAVLILPRFLNLIPLSCLAALLITVGYKLAKPRVFKKTFGEGWTQFIPFIVTVLAVIFKDLLVGIAVGTVVGLGFVIFTNFVSVLTVVRDQNRVLIRFNKDVSFLNKAHLKQELLNLQPGDTVLFDGTSAQFIDHDIFSMVMDFKESAPLRQIKIELKNFNRSTPKIRSVGRSEPV
ncbi:MAG: SulP family inorganic anion transporter [Cytophagaceae bacterium]|nr:SulP family inorganic anion transporter [Cytophagaceae bacterium]